MSLLFVFLYYLYPGSKVNNVGAYKGVSTKLDTLGMYKGLVMHWRVQKNLNYSRSIEVAMKLFTVNRIWSCDEKYRQISARNQNFDKGIYFGKKRLPPPGRRNKLNSKKRKQGKIQLQRKSKKLTMFMSFMYIFPVFYKFFPYFSSYLSNLTFCCTISC